MPGTSLTKLKIFACNIRFGINVSLMMLMRYLLPLHADVVNRMSLLSLFAWFHILFVAGLLKLRAA